MMNDQGIVIILRINAACIDSVDSTSLLAS